MYCPNCGIEERGRSKFCRSCGAELEAVRSTIQRADAITDSATTAREEIGRAMAAKIAEFKTTRELKKITEEILPAIEKFLESPEERRLRQTREGVCTALGGLGISLISALIYSYVQIYGLIGVGLGGLTFLVGLGFIINGLLFTVPRNRAAPPAGPNREDKPATTTTFESGAERHLIPPSVTEVTTHQLKKDFIEPTDPS